VSYILRNLFSGTPFLSQIVCLYFKSFKSNRASNLAVLKKSTQKFNVFGIIAVPLGATARGGGGGYRPVPYIFRKLFSRATATFAWQIVVCLCLESFRSYLASKLTIHEKYKNTNIFGLLGKRSVGLPHILYILESLFHGQHLSFR